MFGFQEDVTLLSYVPKRNKSELLISSMHHDDEIDSNSGEKKKPSVITYYNKTKGSVDVDAMCGSQNPRKVSHNTKEQRLVEDPQPGKRGRCYKCKDSKTKYFCKVCKVWLCLAHA